MNKVSRLLLTYLLCFIGFTVYAQNNHIKDHKENESNVFLHTIERGQTVYSIATMYGVKIDDIYDLNPESKESIKAGSTLKIPQHKVTAKEPGKEESEYIYHTIQHKETLYSLTVKYNIPAAAIINANPGLSANTFNEGRIIRIPVQEQQAVKTKPVVKKIEYTIEKKETIYRICKKFNVTGEELLSLNPELSKGVKAGMTIKIPISAGQKEESKSETPHEREINEMLSTQKKIEPINTIRLVLMLPFMEENAKPDATSSRFIEYYEGLLLAIDSLKEMGYSIDLTVYDTGEGIGKVKKILEENAMKQANLIIGAVANDQISEIAKFAQKNHIRYVIPFTSKNDDVLSNAYVYQVNTPHSYLYAKASQAGCDLFGNDNVVVLNIKDSEEKTDFIKSFKAEMKQRKIHFKELNYNSSSFESDISALLRSDQRNVVVPTSSSEEALNKIKSPLRTITDNHPEYILTLFGYPEWQTYMRTSLDDFYALNTYIYSNFYADNLSKNVSDFYTKYKSWYSKNLINSFPKYGMLGFDTGMFFINALHKYGIRFENHLGKIHYNSLQTNFDFERVNNWSGFINTNIFIVHFQTDFNVTRTVVR